MKRELTYEFMIMSNAVWSEFMDSSESNIRDSSSPPYPGMSENGFWC